MSLTTTTTIMMWLWLRAQLRPPLLLLLATLGRAWRESERASRISSATRASSSNNSSNSRRATTISARRPRLPLLVASHPQRRWPHLFPERLSYGALRPCHFPLAPLLWRLLLLHPPLPLLLAPLLPLPVLLPWLLLIHAVLSLPLALVLLPRSKPLLRPLRLPRRSLRLRLRRC